MESTRLLTHQLDPTPGLVGRLGPAAPGDVAVRCEALGMVYGLARPRFTRCATSTS